MSTVATVNLNEVAASWRSARRMYPIYAALATRFDLGTGACKELESPIDRSEPECLQRIHEWFNTVDQRFEVHQLRQLVQSTQLGSEQNLHVLITRQLKQAEVKKSRTLRDKLDYLMVQYYAHCAPHGAHETSLDFDHVAEVLQPVVGDVSPLLPPFCEELDKVLADLDACQSFGDLLAKQILERSHKIKDSAADQYFLPSVMVAFARFNYLVRLGFFRLMHADLHAVRFALHAMEERGQTYCDCSSAGLSKEESLARVREICHDWKQPFRASYSQGNKFKQIVDIRAAVEKAAAAPPPAPKSAEPAPAVEIPVPETPVASKPVKQIPSAPPAVEKPAVQTKTANAAAAKLAPAAAKAVEELDVDHCLEVIAEQLLKLAATKTPAVANVMVQGSKLVLASWEVNAFIKGGDELSDALQRAVGARALLQLAMERQKTGGPVDLKSPIAAAHTEAAAMQALIAEAKEKKNIDAAVNLAATSKRLLALVEEAEKVQG